MSDEILNLGRADIHHPKGPLTGRAGRSECAEGCAWASHMRGGEPLYVQICMLCERINWEDLAEQVARVRAAVAEDLRRTLAALNVALYWAHPDTPEGRDEIAGCRVALEMGQAALERLRAPSVRLGTDRTPDVDTPDPQRFWWHHAGCCEGPTPGGAQWHEGHPCLGCGRTDGHWTRGAPIADRRPFPSRGDTPCMIRLFCCSRCL